MNDTAWSLAPALGLLLLLAGLAWGAHWLKRRLEPTGSGQGAGVRLVSQLALGERTIATTVGWMQQLSAVGQVSGPPLVAWVAGVAGGWQHTWVVTASCCVAGALLAALIGRQLRSYE